MSTVIWWIRRDVRLIDNQVLLSAYEESKHVVPVFIIDPKLRNSPYFSPRRWNFLIGCLRELKMDLQERGGRLIVRQGDPTNVLNKLMLESGAVKIFAEKDVSLYARKRDRRIEEVLPIQWVGYPTIHMPGTVLKSDGRPYTVFTPYSRTWKALPFPMVNQINLPENLCTPENISSLELPEEIQGYGNDLFPPGEKEANLRLELFACKDKAPIYQYGEKRNNMGINGTSSLSPYLRFGCISARRAASFAYMAMKNAPNSEFKRNAEIWLNELIWRDFYYHVLFHFPYSAKQSFRSDFRSINWINDPEQFQAWCQGKTGYPIVDAAMHQLIRTGWMHNRARMIVASFLTKDLLIDWRWGEKWFMQNLIDGDPASNNGGWQWSAGTGTDAAPYFRIFNPVLQGIKYDTNGDYIRAWVEELENLPEKYIHEPWKMALDQQKKYRCVLGHDYPERIVDHKHAREQTLEVYRKSKNSHA